MSIASALTIGLLVVGLTVALTGFTIERLAVFAVGLLVLTVTWNGVRIGGGAFGDGFLALAGLSVGAYLMASKQKVLLPPWLLLSALIFIVGALLVEIFPADLHIQNITLMQFNQQFAVLGVAPKTLGEIRSNWTALVLFLISLLVVPGIVSVVATTPERIKRLLDLFVIGAVINALFGIADRAGFHITPVAITGTRSAGLTVHANYLALTCIFAMPLALRWVGRSQKGTIAGLTATLILIGGEYVTGSRDGTVGAAVALLLTITFLPRTRALMRYILPLLAIVLVVVLAFTNAGQQILKQVRLNGPTVSTVGSNYERAVAKAVAESQISSAPIWGVGFAVDNDAQNIFLQILAAGGVIAGIAFLTLIGGLANCVRRSLNGPLREEAIALGVCVLAWLLNGYYDSQFADKYLYILPGVLIAVGRVSTARSKQAAAAAPPLPVPQFTVPVALPSAGAVAAGAVAAGASS